MTANPIFQFVGFVLLVWLTVRTAGLMLLSLQSDELKPWQRWAAVAASVAILLFIGLVIWPYYSPIVADFVEAART